VIKKAAYYRDLAKIEKAWKKWLERPILKPSQKRQEMGYYSIANVAALCDVAPSTLQHHIKLNAIKPPCHTLDGVQGKYYRRREKNSIVRFIEKRRRDHPFMDVAAGTIKGKTRRKKKE
jgi:hypothetical protein